MLNRIPGDKKGELESLVLGSHIPRRENEDNQDTDLLSSGHVEPNEERDWYDDEDNVRQNVCNSCCKVKSHDVHTVAIGGWNGQVPAFLNRLARENHQEKQNDCVNPDDCEGDMCHFSKPPEG